MSYEEALESARPYEEANAAVDNLPDNKGLGPDEFDPDAVESGDTGVWAKLSGGASGRGYIELSGSPHGLQCAPKGVLGRTTGEQCDHQGNGDFDCEATYSYYACE
ncbi:hypothetical protein JCM19232_4971 [Vibrio ishigakensis]|uniref:Uncharacterized protein n=1 Tax=Vibrio ishigakensis TaxID=1481914 RepID=A0A0B8PGN7_9VIBR|nr:hypothetical protein JCM19232_4971 [Vibrio ishigakensis]